MIILDIETTGLDPETHQIIEIAAYCTLRKEWFDAKIKYENVVIGPYCLKLHANRDWTVGDTLLNVRGRWVDFVGSGKHTFCGKNVASFDIPFMKRNRFEVNNHHRILDIGSVFWNGEEDVLPDLAECCRRVGLERRVTHTAREDVQLVLDVLEAYRDR